MTPLYYREKETGDSKHPPHRVVTIEDLLGTLVDVHGQVGHGGRQRIDTHLRGHDTHVPRPVIQLFLDLCSICQETKGKKSSHNIILKPIISETVGVRGHADLVDLQLFKDNGYKFILNYQDCKTKTAVEVADCLMGIFFEHGPPSLLQTNDGAEFSNKTLWPRLRSSGQARASCTAGHAIRRTRAVWSELIRKTNLCSTAGSRM